MKKRSILLLVAAILGTAYAAYLIWYFNNINSTAVGIESVAAFVATKLIKPHMICTVVAVIFNWLGFAMKARWGALVAGIMYAVAMVCMLMYAYFVIVQMVLCFVAFAKMKPNSPQTPAQA